jgi:hypothetical protein
MSSALARRIVTLALLALLALPAGARASGDDVLVDCGDDGALSRKYTQAEYKEALANLPADQDEYSDCRDVIKRARLRLASGRDNGGPDVGNSTGGSAPNKPKISKRKKSKIERQLKSVDLAAARPLRIGDSLVKPGDLGSSSKLPAPLIAVLALTLLGAAGASAIAIRRIVNGRRSE